MARDLCKSCTRIENATTHITTAQVHCDAIFVRLLSSKNNKSTDSHLPRSTMTKGSCGGRGVCYFREVINDWPTQLTFLIAVFFHSYENSPDLCLDDT